MPMNISHSMMKNNYHTHMYLCKHATGHVKDYVKQAIDLKFHSIGMSDHAPFPILRDRSVRMFPEELSEYFKELEEATIKYESQIKIWRGLEIEYFRHSPEYYSKLLEQLDYLALGQHYIEEEGSRDGLRSSYSLNKPEHLRTYAKTVIDAMSTKSFAFLCHPDLMLYGYPRFDEVAQEVSRDIIRAAVEYEIPLEINANGIRKGIRQLEEGQRYLYPRKEFWQIAKEMNAKVIISSDAHHVDQLMDGAVLLAYEFATDIGIVVEEAIDLKR